jgi:hypothetical protein
MTASTMATSGRGPVDEFSTTELVWVVSKTHLDMGFTSRRERVLDQFLHDYIPRAIELARRLSAKAGSPRFVWTLGSWLTWWSLERSGPAQRRDLEEAIGAGHLTWHALPFSMHSELLDGWLLDEGLAISAELDERFGRKTTAAKMTDVPGHTVAIVPHLAAAGVQLLHIGVNPAAQVPAVPPIFRWELGDAEVMVMYSPTYGQLQEMPGRRSLSVAMTGDNLGPPTLSEHVAHLEQLAQRCPGAELVAAGLEPAATHLAQFRDQLPVVRGEIGDSWIHGAGAHPHLLAAYREALRRRRRAGHGAAGTVGAVPRALGRNLLLLPEHTWGLDHKLALDASTPYDEDGVRMARAAGMFDRLEQSWAEKAQPVFDALELLEPAPGPHGRAPLGATEGVDAGPPRAGASAVAILSAGSGPHEAGRAGEEGAGRVEEGGWRVAVDAADGALLVTAWPGGAGPGVEVGRYCYQTFAQADYERFFHAYIRPEELETWWVRGDYGKPGLDRQPVSSKRSPACLTGAWRLPEPSPKVAVRLMVELAVSPGPGLAYGYPRRLVADYQLLAHQPEVRATLWRLQKPACRLPEAEWYAVRPVVPGAALFWHKVDSWIPAAATVPGGGNRLHAVQDGVAWTGGDGPGLLLDCLDSPLVAPGRGYLLDPGDDLPPVGDGVSACLSNNVWGTNFPAWNDADCRFRFTLRPLPTGLPT